MHILRTPTSKFLLIACLLVCVVLLATSPVQANIIGDINPPTSIQNINTQSGGEIGLIFLISRIVNFFIVVSGIAATFNFIIAGGIFITSAGDTGAYGKVKDRLTYGTIGMIIVATSLTLAGLIGLVFFGDASFILNPTLYNPGPSTPPPPP